MSSEIYILSYAIRLYCIIALMRERRHAGINMNCLLSANLSAKALYYPGQYSFIRGNNLEANTAAHFKYMDFLILPNAHYAGLGEHECAIFECRQYNRPSLSFLCSARTFSRHASVAFPAGV